MKSKGGYREFIVVCLSLSLLLFNGVGGFATPSSLSFEYCVYVSSLFVFLYVPSVLHISIFCGCLCFQNTTRVWLVYFKRWKWVLKTKKAQTPNQHRQKQKKRGRVGWQGPTWHKTIENKTKIETKTKKGKVWGDVGTWNNTIINQSEVDQNPEWQIVIPKWQIMSPDTPNLVCYYQHPKNGGRS